MGNVFGGFCMDMVVTSTLSDTISAFFDCCVVVKNTIRILRGVMKLVLIVIPRLVGSIRIR